MARRRFVRGDRAFRRILKRLPDAIRGEMLAMLDTTGDAILAVQQAGAPNRTGAVKQALSKRLQRGLVRLRVGLVGKPINRRLFYANIVEGGRKGGGRGVKRKSAKYASGVGRLPKRPFIVTNETNRIRETMAGQMQGYWDKVLSRASTGVTDD